MEFLRTTEAKITAVLLAGIGMIGLAACGQYDPPSTAQVKDKIQYFELDGVTDGTGEPVHCVMYGDGTQGTQDSKSWFAFSCDFSGTAQFPGER